MECEVHESMLTQDQKDSVLLGMRAHEIGGLVHATMKEMDDLTRKVRDCKTEAAVAEAKEALAKNKADILSMLDEFMDICCGRLAD